jgi:hypothetical protein
VPNEQDLIDFIGGSDGGFGKTLEQLVERFDDRVSQTVEALLAKGLVRKIQTPIAETGDAASERQASASFESYVLTDAGLLAKS